MIEKLLNFNPWWSSGEDPHLRKWRSMKYSWIPKWITQLGLEPFSMNFVIGPRQVGKTTGIKLLIQDLLRDKDPESIFYVTCELFPTFSELRETVDEIAKFTRKEGFDELFLFLDEVTSLKEWWKGIKPLIDSGLLENFVITVTGSSVLKLKRDVELFPGRRGKGKNIEVFPLNFKEFVEIHGVKPKKTREYEIKELFQKYLEIGGSPPAINGLPLEDVLSSFVGEIIRAGKSLEIAKEVISSVISKMPSPMSYRAVASETSGYSYKVVQEYLETLRSLYLIETAHLKRGNTVFHRKEKKFFFRDPLYLRLFSLWSNAKFLESAIYENIVQEHLLRKFGEIFYYKNGYEIDCVADNLKVEVKAGKPHRRYPKNVTVLDETEIPFFLIELFADEK